MKNSLVTSGVSISICLLALTGCASNQETTGDLMRDAASAEQSQADRKRQIARDWEKGKDLIAKGESRIESGEDQFAEAEDDLEDARDEIERGRRQIAEGEKLVRESERKFREDYPDVDLNQMD